jgi:Flp pilus assembly CpaE family ATPase
VRGKARRNGQGTKELGSPYVVSEAEEGLRAGERPPDGSFARIAGEVSVRRDASALAEGAGQKPDGTVPLRPARPRMLLGIADLGFHQEVLDFLGRDPRLEVAGAATDPNRLASLLAPGNSDAVLVCPTMSRGLRHPVLRGRGNPLLVVCEEMTVPVLREAIESHAHAVFCWPEERDELAKAIIELRSERAEKPSNRGRVVAVYGARGGAGTTFIASHLAAIAADRGSKAVLVDLDTGFSDVTAALGIVQGRQVRTIADLVPVMDELSPDHLEDALYRHPRGFDVLLGPGEVSVDVALRPGLFRAAIALLAGSHQAVILHIPRMTHAVARAGIELADEVLLASTLDLFSLYGARRAMAALRLEDPPDRCRVVINRVGRAEMKVGDVERVLGRTIGATIRFDPNVKRVQGRGELLRPGARRSGRDLRALASMLFSHRSESIVDEPAAPGKL